MSQPAWIERHSVNCYFCNALVDERECVGADEYNGGDGGDICRECQTNRVKCWCDQFHSSDMQECSDWKCRCGNHANAAGLFPCEPNGTYREPEGDWQGHYRCDQCGAIVEQHGAIVGQWKEENNATN